jgi:hypothetical protein
VLLLKNLGLVQGQNLFPSPFLLPNIYPYGRSDDFHFTLAEKGPILALSTRCFKVEKQQH